MDKNILTPELVERFAAFLAAQERADGTIQKYLHDVRSFRAFLDGREVTKAEVVAWKEHLRGAGLCPSTVNSMLAALHSLFEFTGWTEYKVKYFRVQRRLFRAAERELDRNEHKRLIETARAQGDERLALLIEAIGGTGVRVSEVKYLTVEAAQQGRAEIELKGKIRTIIISNKLARKLLKYARKKKIASGEIFITRSGRGMSRRQIWGEMKRLCSAAGVEPSKVFPHNLRHLFARVYYKSCKDIARLADVLGHSNIETTRIYLVTSGKEHARQLDKLGLVS